MYSGDEFYDDDITSGIWDDDNWSDDEDYENGTYISWDEAKEMLAEFDRAARAGEGL